MNQPPAPDAILQTAFGFWNSKVLLTAVELGLFTVLAHRRLSGTELGKELGLHPRGIADFLDALVAMKFLAISPGPPAPQLPTSKNMRSGLLVTGTKVVVFVGPEMPLS